MLQVYFAIFLSLVQTQQIQSNNVNGLIAHLNWLNSTSVCAVKNKCGMVSNVKELFDQLKNSWMNSEPLLPMCVNGNTTYSMTYTSCVKQHNGVHICEIPYNDKCTKHMYIGFMTNRSARVSVNFSNPLNTQNDTQQAPTPKPGTKVRPPHRQIVNGKKLVQVWVQDEPQHYAMEVNISCSSSPACLEDTSFIVAEQCSYENCVV